MTPPERAHRIRLRKPWERCDQILQMTGGSLIAERSVPAESRESRVDVPDLSPADFDQSAGTSNVVYRVTYRRKFHRPSGIDPNDCVQLEVGGVRGGIIEIRINRIVVSSGGQLDHNSYSTHRWDLDDQLADHNELEIEMESTADAPGPPRLVGDVNLWIISSE